MFKFSPARGHVRVAGPLICNWIVTWVLFKLITEVCSSSPIPTSQHANTRASLGPPLLRFTLLSLQSRLMQTPEEYYDFIVHRKESMRYLLNKTEASMLPKPERRKFCLVSIHRMGTRRFQPALRDPSLDIKFTCHLPMAPIIPRAVPGIWTGDIPLSFDRPNLVGKKDKIPQLSCWEFCNSHIFIILWVSGPLLQRPLSEHLRWN